MKFYIHLNVMVFVHNTCNIMLIQPPYICDSKLNICDTLSNILKGTMNMKQYIKKRTGAVNVFSKQFYFEYLQQFLDNIKTLFYFYLN